ncbi:aspartate racemase [Ruminococcaceae bacterium KH2T8]|nr:aspartate racemase [Ruminococcaceae bacterium KH2T8]
MSLGVIGGMGPMATACFLEILTEKTYAERDGDHLETIIYSCPQIPDRTSFILGKSDSDPRPKIIETALKLQREGVSAIAVPCVTARSFKEEIQASVDVPILFGVEAAARKLSESGIRKAGIMATDGSIKTRVIQDVLESFGIEAVIPSDDDRAKVMSLIYDDVKTGRDPDLDKLREVRDNLTAAGAQTVILGCTELSVINRSYKLEDGYFDILEMLAEEALEACGMRVRA